MTPSPRTMVPADAVPTGVGAVPATAVPGQRSAWLRVVAATVCTPLGHRAFNADLPAAGQCCSRCFTLRGEDARRWSGS